MQSLGIEGGKLRAVSIVEARKAQRIAEAIAALVAAYGLKGHSKRQRGVSGAESPDSASKKSAIWGVVEVGKSLRNACFK